MRRLQASMLAFLFFVSSARADEALLMLPGEAKGAALGEAFSASASGADGLWYNPATLSLQQAQSASLMHTSYLEDVTFNTVATALPFGNRNAVGVGISYLNVGSVTGFDNTGASAPSYSPEDLSARIGIAKSIRNTSFGLAAYFLRSTIVDTASTIGFNAGVHQILGPVSLALVGENFGGKLKYETEENELPQRIKLGADFQVLQRASVKTEIFKPKSGSIYAGAGLEYAIDAGDEFGLVLRSGYNTRASDIEGLHGLSAGAGFGVKSTELNYAWVPFGDLGQTHRISLDYLFGPDGSARRARREERSRSFVKPAPKKASRDVASPEVKSIKAQALPLMPWKRSVSGWRTAKEKIMDLLARDALCSNGSARALVTRAVGNVELKADGELRRSRRIRAGQYLFDGDTVQTHAQAYAHLVFANGARVEMGPDTVFSVEPSEEICEIASIKLESGKVYAAVEAGKTFNVKTPAGEKKIEGAEAWISYDGKKVVSETPRTAVRITEPDSRSTPGRWDPNFAKTFEREIMRLDSVPGLALAEYVRDTTLRDQLKGNVSDMLSRQKEMRAQVANFKEDVAGFTQLKAELQKYKEGSSRKEDKERRQSLKQAVLALRNAQNSLKDLQKDLKQMLKTMRESQEFLASVPIVRMLNITARESTIPFAKGRSVVPEESTGVLDAISESMAQMKPYRIVVEGHTDKTGSDRANVRLSKQRAEAVAQYLRKKTGFPARMFVTKGAGSSQPIDPGENTEAMAKNRRVEIWFELRGL